ncbi:MAG: M24 family metallopeptidase [Chloroflexota bacterium]
MNRIAFTDTDRIRRLIGESGLDAVVATSPENVTHTSGYYNLDQRLLPEHLHACVWTADGEPTLVIPARERRLEVFVRDVREHLAPGGSDDHGLDLVTAALRERGLSGGVIGLDLFHLPALLAHGLATRLPSARIVDASDLLARMRAVKTPAEIELLHGANRATEKAIMLGYAQARPGDTEKSVVDAMDHFTAKLGAEAVAFNIIASGERTIQGHHRGEAVAIKAGDLLRVDYGGLFDGYFTDLVRMAVVGKPVERQRATYAACYAVHQRCLAALRPGLGAQALFELAERAYSEVGLPITRTMYGHSIGLKVHERPVIQDGDEWPLEMGMVLCIENGYTDRGVGERYHLEDAVAITSSGYRLLSDYSDSSELYVID